MSPPVLSLIAAFLFAIAYGWTSDFAYRTSPSTAQGAAATSPVGEIDTLRVLRRPETRTAGWFE